MLASLLYVSRSRLAMPMQGGEVDVIVEQSVARNARLHIRGALVFTEKHFAQVLEGPAEAVAELMTSIEGDPRHELVTVAAQGDIKDYRFPNWALAYRGGASFMDQQVSALLRKPDGHYDGEAARLYEIIRRLAVECADKGPIGRTSPR